MKVEYSYPESIGKIVHDLEDKLITLYAKVGKMIYEKNQKTEMEIHEKDSKGKNS